MVIKVANNWNDRPSPKFGVLRPLGDFKGKIRDSDIYYEDLWKHDEYIHHLVDPSAIEIPDKPNAPKKSLFKSQKQYNKELANYMQLVKEYNLAIDKKRNALAIQKLHEKIKSENHYMCYFCGFEDHKFLEIHHLDSNHFNNTQDNLKPACTLCHRQHHLLWLSVTDQAELGAANLNYLPQVELNHLQRIAIVMNHNPEYAALMGVNGRLGANILQLKNNFTRPLSAFLIPDSVKGDAWTKHLTTKNLDNPANGKSANYLVIEKALENMDRPSPEKTIKEAIEVYDYFIGLADQKKLDPNATDEDIRNKHRMVVRELMTKYEKAHEYAFEENFNTNADTFSIFELAMALGAVDYKDYQKFDPKYLYLIFKESIFTPEQIEYYLTLDYFNVEKWGFGDH